MLVGSLELDATPAIASLGKMDAKFGSTMAVLTTLGARAGKSLGGLLLGAFSLHKVFSGLKGAMDLGGELSDLQAQTGQSASDLLTLRQAFINAGLGADATGDMISKFQLAMAGTSLENASTIDQLGAMQRAFEEIENPVERTAKAYELFGKAGPKILRILGDPTALETAKQQVGGLAETMEKYHEALDSMGDSLGAVDTKQKQFWTAMLGGALPELNKTIGDLNKIDLTKFGESCGKALSFLASGITPVTEAILGLNMALDDAADWISGTKQAPAISEAYTRKELDARFASKQSALSKIDLAPSTAMVSALQRVGGGGGIGFGGGDPLREQLSELRKLNQNLQRLIDKNPSKEVPRPLV